jgi:hypothetical protein
MSDFEREQSNLGDLSCYYGIREIGGGLTKLVGERLRIYFEDKVHPEELRS